MKKYTFLMLVCVSGFAIHVAAQKMDSRNVVSVSAGLNLFQNFDLVSSYSDLNTVNLQIKATPAIGFTYDYGVTNWLSLGVAGAYNHFRFKADQIVVPRETKSTYVGTIDLNMARISVGIRPLIHYGHLKRVDMYSGLRLGVNIWKTSLESNGDLLPEEVDRFLHDDSVTANFQVIPFGMRYYVIKKLAIGLETGFGAPHYAAFMLNCKI
jgi:hypothetical protein